MRRVRTWSTRAFLSSPSSTLAPLLSAGLFFVRQKRRRAVQQKSPLGPFFCLWNRISLALVGRGAPDFPIESSDSKKDSSERASGRGSMSSRIEMTRQELWELVWSLSLSRTTFARHRWAARKPYSRRPQSWRIRVAPLVGLLLHKGLASLQRCCQLHEGAEQAVWRPVNAIGRCFGWPFREAQSR